MNPIDLLALTCVSGAHSCMPPLNLHFQNEADGLTYWHAIGAGIYHGWPAVCD